jgi:hypothetical protein
VDGKLHCLPNFPRASAAKQLKKNGPAAILYAKRHLQRAFGFASMPMFWKNIETRNF